MFAGSLLKSVLILLFQGALKTTTLLPEPVVKKEDILSSSDLDNSSSASEAGVMSSNGAQAMIAQMSASLKGESFVYG